MCACPARTHTHTHQSTHPPINRSCVDFMSKLMANACSRVHHTHTHTHTHSDTHTATQSTHPSTLHVCTHTPTNTHIHQSTHPPTHPPIHPPIHTKCNRSSADCMNMVTASTCGAKLCVCGCSCVCVCVCVCACVYVSMCVCEREWRKVVLRTIRFAPNPFYFQKKNRSCANCMSMVTASTCGAKLVRSNLEISIVIVLLAPLGYTALVSLSLSLSLSLFFLSLSLSLSLSVLLSLSL